MDVSDDDAEPEVVETEPKSSSKKGLIGTLAKGFSTKRKPENRSPEALASQQPTVRQRLVGVFVPPPPIPHASYIQFGQRRPPSPPSIASGSEAPPLPPSSSPSLVSLASRGSDRDDATYEVERLRLLYSASQEELVRQREHYEDRERRAQEVMAAERAVYESHILELQKRHPGEGRSSSRRG